MSQKKQYFLLTLFLFLLLQTRVYSEATTKDKQIFMSKMLSGYHSQLGSLGNHGKLKQRKRVYNLYQLMNLRKAIAPRYIRLLNQKQYIQTAKILQKGILFTYKALKAKKVLLAGDFNNWTGMPMQRNKKGVFFHVLPLRKIEEGKKIKTYRYKFIVDGIWTHDPQSKTNDSLGSEGTISIFYLEEIPLESQISIRVLQEKEKNNDYLVEFAIYLPKVQDLSLVGDFNNWNPEHDILHKSADGIFRRRLRLKSGYYVYKYVADGKWMLDTYNPNTRFESQLQELCSFIELP